ncbi:hypothetical protein HBI65_162220 [Parastagonospora nodorum]|nr:hypothetical protein HBI65_162220 [Parastagonospora nodorum]
MSQTNVREGYEITTLEVVKLIEDLTSYVKKKDLLEKIQSEKSQSQLLKSLLAKCTQLRNTQIPKVFHEAAAGTIWTMMLAKVRYNTPTPTLSETAQRRSSSVVSNRSTASITDKFGVASLTKPAILNDANVALVDAVHHSVVKQFPMFRLMTKESQQKLEENYFEYQAGTSQVMNALTMTLIEDDDDLLGTVNSHIKSRRLRAVMLLCQTTKLPGDSNKVTFQPNEPPEQPLLPEQPSPPKKRGRYSKLILDGPPLKRRKTEAADSRHAKASRGRTKKDKDSEDSNTSSDRLGKEAQLKKTRDEEELAKAKKEKEEKEARERETQPDSPLDSDDYCLDSSSDINPKDDSEDEEATTAKDLAREQKERLKALLNAKTRDSLSARVGTAIEHCTLEEWTSAAVFFGVSIDNLQNKRTIKLPAYAYILYFKELLSDNGGIFANAIGMGKTRAIVLAVLMGHVHFKNWTEVQNARAEGDATEHNAVDDDDKLCPTKGERTFYCACERSLSFNAEPQQAAIIITSWGRAANAWKNEVYNPSDPLALQFCFFSDSLPENIGRLMKEEAMEMRIDTTNAISKALAAANKLVAPQSYVLGGATKHCLAPSAARFVIVCSFRKVDKHVFRAYNTISVTAQRTIIRKGGPHMEKRAILLPGHVTKAWALSGTPMEQGLNKILIFVSLALISLQNRKERDSVTGDRIYKMEDAVYQSIAETLSHRTRQNTALNSLAMAKQWRNIIANVKHDASEHESSHKFMLKRTLKTRDPWGKPISSIKGDFLPYFQSCPCPDFLSTVQNAEQQCRDILEKEGLDESEASRRMIFNCFEMQAIASYPALATLKAAQFKTYSSRKVKRFTSNSVKDLFTNPSKDHFLVREARAITKSSLKFQNLSNLCSKLGLREKFSDESVLVMQRGMTQHEINLKLAKWRDPDGPWIIVASMAFAEAITLTEATHVVIMELQDRQNTQDQFMFRVYRLSQLAEMCVGIVYFNPDSELELKVLGKQDVKTTSRDKLQGRGSTVTDQRMD